MSSEYDFPRPFRHHAEGDPEAVQHSRSDVSETYLDRPGNRPVTVVDGAQAGPVPNR